jgi:hypothetical protein
MNRSKRNPRRIAIIVIALVTLFITACDNPINILETIETEYKRAENLFLVVEGFSPLSNTFNVNPGAEIRIEFDRPINLDSVTDSTLKIYDAAFNEVGWSFSRYNSATNTLYIKGAPFLSNTTEYTVSVQNVQGRSGEVLQDAVAWTFVTGSAPAGSIVELKSANFPDSQQGYSNTGDIEILISGNDLVSDFWLTNNEDDANNSDEYEDTNNYTTIGQVLNTATERTLQSGDPGYISLDTSTQGIKNVFVRFANNRASPWSFSLFDEATIIYDSLHPFVDLGVDRGARNSAFTIIASAGDDTSETDDVSGIDPDSVDWRKVSGIGSVVFTEHPTIPGRAIVSVSGDSSDWDGDPYVITLEVSDRAGNISDSAPGANASSDDTLSFIWDTVGPARPDFDSGNSRSAADYPFYSVNILRESEEVLSELLAWRSGGNGGSGNFLILLPQGGKKGTGTSYQFFPEEEMLSYANRFEFLAYEFDDIENPSVSPLQMESFFFPDWSRDGKAPVGPYVFNEDMNFDIFRQDEWYNRLREAELLQDWEKIHFTFPYFLNHTVTAGSDLSDPGDVSFKTIEGQFLYRIYVWINETVGPEVYLANIESKNWDNPYDIIANDGDASRPSTDLIGDTSSRENRQFNSEQHEYAMSDGDRDGLPGIPLSALSIDPRILEDRVVYWQFDVLDKDENLLAASPIYQFFTSKRE